MPASCTSDSRKPACTSAMPSASCSTGTAGGSLPRCSAAADAGRDHDGQGGAGSECGPQAPCATRSWFRPTAPPGEALVLAHREAVGHAGDVVGHRARRGRRRAAKSGRHLARARPGRRANSSRTTCSRLSVVCITCGCRYRLRSRKRLSAADCARIAVAEAHQRRQRARRVGVGRRALRRARRASRRSRRRPARCSMRRMRLVQQRAGPAAPGCSRQRLAAIALEQRAPRRSCSSVIRPERTPSSMSCAL